MEITFERAKSILNTLPVSYYLKRKIKVDLVKTGTSYIDFLKDTLFISYRQLTNALLTYSTIDFSNEEIEKNIRCLMYHEVSHALLTPKELGAEDIINIFEDERIETILKDFYLNTDFKSFVKKVNHYKGEAPINAMQKFYHVVRFRVGEKEYLDRVNQIIMTYTYINSSTWSTSDLIHYRIAIRDLYEDIKKSFESDNEDKLNKKQFDNSSNLPTKISTNTCNNSIDVSKETKENIDDDNSELTKTTGKTYTDSTKNEKNIDEDNKESTETLLRDATQKAITSAIANVQTHFDNLNDSNLQTLFNGLILNKQKQSKLNGSAINSYSGVFDYRSTIRNDYKYFVQKNRNGNVKRFSKVKLNLFIDTSGSFWASEQIVNKFIYNLIKLEQKNKEFSFDVVSMSKGEKLLDKSNRFIHCCGGNYLDDNASILYKKLQDNTSENINIVMFDGDAFTDIPRHKQPDGFKAFNQTSTIIISNYENMGYIQKYAPFANTTLVRYDYAKLLIQNTINALKETIR